MADIYAGKDGASLRTGLSRSRLLLVNRELQSITAWNEISDLLMRPNVNSTPKSPILGEWVTTVASFEPVRGPVNPTSADTGASVTPGVVGVIGPDSSRVNTIVLPSALGPIARR